jgi:hypothetical protein
MKKFVRIMALFLCIIVISSFCSCSNSIKIQAPKNDSIGKLIGDSYYKIDKIVFLDGTGRNKDFTLTDKNSISVFLNNYINKCTITEVNAPVKLGFARGTVFFVGNKAISVITFSNPLSIGLKSYKITSGKLTYVEVDKFLKSVNKKWIPYTP